MSHMVLETTARNLVERCQRGEREAFRALFETYKDKVYSLALRFAGDEAAAMDIAQDTFVKLFHCIGDFRGDSGFETWVYRIVVNRCLDQKRRTRRLVPLADELMATLRVAGDALSQMLRDEMGSRVRAAVEKLPADQRIAIVLRYTEGLAYEQIAEVLGCSQGTIASRLSRAHKALERTLAALARERHHA
jgi:RNA polymerase sigma-70 factor, ECF subfamily